MKVEVEIRSPEQIGELNGKPALVVKWSQVDVSPSKYLRRNREILEAMYRHGWRPPDELLYKFCTILPPDLLQHEPRNRLVTAAVDLLYRGYRGHPRAAKGICGLLNKREKRRVVREVLSRIWNKWWLDGFCKAPRLAELAKTLPEEFELPKRFAKKFLRELRVRDWANAPLSEWESMRYDAPEYLFLPMLAKLAKLGKLPRKVEDAARKCIRVTFPALIKAVKEDPEEWTEKAAEIAKVVGVFDRRAAARLTAAVLKYT
jgi:hypothetical protein